MSHLNRQATAISTLLAGEATSKGDSGDGEDAVVVEVIVAEGYGADLEWFDKRALNVSISAISPAGEGTVCLALRVPRASVQGFAEEWATVVDELEAREAIVEQGGNKKKPSRGTKALASVEAVRLAVAKSLFVGPDDYLPSDETEEVWWEIWLDQARLDWVKVMAERNGLRFEDDLVAHFADRVVCLLRCSVNKLHELKLLAAIAELRKPQFTVGFLMRTDRQDAKEFQSAATEGRVSVAEVREAVVLIDSGVNGGHPLIEAADGLRNSVAVYAPTTADDENHGTGTASVLLYGKRLDRFIDGLDDTAEITLFVDSVNVLPPSGERDNPSPYGPATVAGCMKLPDRDARLFVSTVTHEDASPEGASDTYSAAIDLFAFGLNVNTPHPHEETGFTKVLFVQAAGNVPHWERDTPADDGRRRVQSPAQSWNALTVGAFTELPEGRLPTASYGSEQGALSHYTTDSLGYESKRAYVPDVVFEGGNTTLSQAQHQQDDPSSLLCANSKYRKHPFATLWGTSAAAALAGRFCARLQQRYPQYWPETIRALTVNSARWTAPMTAMLGAKKNKTDHSVLLQQCGFGAPDLDIALDSERNRVTLIREASLRPFKKDANGVSMGQLDFIELPWPEIGLKEQASEEVTMRVTLSYFIEPNPSTRELLTRYRYESFGLRYRFQRPTESKEHLHASVNALANGKSESGSTAEWLIGTDNRHRGSIHSDIWRGTGADLARMKHLVVYPVAGWWKSRTKSKRFDNDARYSLIITIESTSDAIDLYSEVDALITADAQIHT